MEIGTCTNTLSADESAVQNKNKKKNKYVKKNKNQRKRRCSLCGAFVRNSDFDEHTKNHSTCARCGKSFEHKYQYRLHMRMHTLVDKRSGSHVCERCCQKFSSLKKIQLHCCYEDIEGNIEIVCNDIDFDTNNSDTDTGTSPSILPQTNILKDRLLSTKSAVTEEKCKEDYVIEIEDSDDESERISFIDCSKCNRKVYMKSQLITNKSVLCDSCINSVYSDDEDDILIIDENVLI